MTERTFYPPTESDIPIHGWRPYSDMHRERIRAHKKHDDHGGSMERKAFDDPAWLPVLVEEVGEVARVLCDIALGQIPGRARRAVLREELVQVGAMTAAWIDAIDSSRDPGELLPFAAIEDERAAEANQDSDGEARCSMAECPNPQAAWGVCGEHMPDIGRNICAEENPTQPGEICWKPSSHGAVEGTPCRYAPASQVKEGEADDLDQAGTKPADETPEHTEAVYDDGAAKLRETKSLGGISASQSHVVTSGTSGLMAPIAPGAVVYTSQQPNIVQQVRDEIAAEIRRQGGTTGLTGR